MTKTELIKVVRDTVAESEVFEGVAVTTKDASVYVETIINTIQDAVANGEKVSITGFGSFEPVVRVARTGHNPHDGSVIDIPESKAPKFKPGKNFKDLVKNS